jgi:hypothetical protein
LLKNFPHQINDLDKLTRALRVAHELINAGEEFDDDGVFGKALAHAGVYSFRNKALSVAENIAVESGKPLGNQGFRTAARDIRRFLSLADLIRPDFTLTQRGRAILEATDVGSRNKEWREAMLQLGLGNSHPYSIMLRLVADRPGIESSKLLLALEAQDDGAKEYARILALSDLTFSQIVAALHISEANARNAVKILPGIAEQTGDLIRNGTRMFLNEPSREQQPPEESLDVPPIQPAAIEPLWDGERLTISPRPAATDLKEQDFAAALSSLRDDLREFAEEIGRDANIDPRFLAFVHRLVARIPDELPTQYELFRLGHLTETFSGYNVTVRREWSDYLASRYQALALQFDRVLRQSTLWREFRRNAAKQALSDEQLALTVPLAQQTVDALRAEDAAEFIHQSVPLALEELALLSPDSDDVIAHLDDGTIRFRSELLAIDVVESINNILKRVAEAAFAASAVTLNLGRKAGSTAVRVSKEYIKEVGAGLLEEAKKQGRKDGATLFRWLRRAAIGGGSIGGLFAKFPEAFEWLRAIIASL